MLLDCVTESNPEATVSWAKMNGTLSPSQARKPKILELPLVELEHEGKFICRAQNPLGSQQVSLTLCVHCELGGRGLGRQDTWVLGRAEASLTLIPPPHRPPKAADTLVLLGGPESALQLLISSPPSCLLGLAAGEEAGGGKPQQRLLHSHFQLGGTLGQQLPEPQQGAQLRPQVQL